MERVRYLELSCIIKEESNREKIASLSNWFIPLFSKNYWITIVLPQEYCSGEELSQWGTLLVGRACAFWSHGPELEPHVGYGACLKNKKTKNNNKKS